MPTVYAIASPGHVYRNHGVMSRSKVRQRQASKEPEVGRFVMATLEAALKP